MDGRHRCFMSLARSGGWSQLSYRSGVRWNVFMVVLRITLMLKGVYHRFTYTFVINISVQICGSLMICFLSAGRFESLFSFCTLWMHVIYCIYALEIFTPKGVVLFYQHSLYSVFHRVKLFLILIKSNGHKYHSFDITSLTFFETQDHQDWHLTFLLEVL